MRSKDSQFQDRLLGSMPKFTVSLLATMLGFAVTIRIIGIDISTPINNILNAKAKIIESEVITYDSDKLKELEERVRAIEVKHKMKPH
jgi:hypothetical protein